MYGLTLTSAPASEPVTVAELREWCRVDSEAHDAVLTGLGKAARDLVEKTTGRALVTQTWRLSLDGFPWPGGWQILRNPSVWPDPRTIRLPKAPLQSVSSITYTDMSGNSQTLASTVYDVDATTDPGRITLALGQVWPVTRPKPGAVLITFVAGYGAATAVPDMLKTAIKFTVACWLENRGEAGGGELPAAARTLLSAHWNGELEYGM